MQEGGGEIPKSISPPAPEAPSSPNGFQPAGEAPGQPTEVLQQDGKAQQPNEDQPQSTERPSDQPQIEQDTELQKKTQELLEKLLKPKTQEQKTAEVLLTIASAKTSEERETFVDGQPKKVIEYDGLGDLALATLQSDHLIYFDDQGNPAFRQMIFVEQPQTTEAGQTPPAEDLSEQKKQTPLSLEHNQQNLQIARIDRFDFNSGLFICIDIKGQQQEIPRLTVLEALHRRFQEAAKQKGTPESQYEKKTKALADKLMDSVRKTEATKATPKTQTQPENQQQDETTQIEQAEQPDQPEQPEEPEESITDGDIEAVIKENKEALAERGYLLIQKEELKSLFEKLKNQILGIEDSQKKQRYLTKLTEILTDNSNQAFLTRDEFREILSLGLGLKREELITQFHLLQGQEWVQEQLGDLAAQIKELSPERITALVDEATSYLFKKLNKNPNFFDEIKKDLEEGNIQRLINNLIASEAKDEQQRENLKRTGKTIGIGLLAILLMIMWKSKDEMKDGQQGMTTMLGH